MNSIIDFNLQFFINIFYIYIVNGIFLIHILQLCYNYVQFSCKIGIILV